MVGGGSSLVLRRRAVIGSGSARTVGSRRVVTSRPRIPSSYSIRRRHRMFLVRPPSVTARRYSSSSAVIGLLRLASGVGEDLEQVSFVDDGALVDTTFGA